jgi:hypothetical protein
VEEIQSSGNTAVMIAGNPASFGDNYFTPNWAAIVANAIRRALLQHCSQYSDVSDAYVDLRKN